MCNIWQEKTPPELNLDQIRAILTKGVTNSIRFATISGGEPTLRLDLPDIVVMLVDSAPHLEYLVLATAALNPRLVVRQVKGILAELEARRDKVRLHKFVVQISLDGIGIVHDEIRGIKGFYSRVRDTVAELGRLRAEHPLLELHMSCVVMPGNLSHLEEVRRFAKRMEAQVHFCPVVFSPKYYNNLESEGIALRPGESPEAVAFFRRMGEEEQSSLKFYYRDVSHMLEGSTRSRNCMMGVYGLVLEHDGRIYPCVNCEEAEFGNLAIQSFEEAWRGSQAQAARAKLRETCCPTCTSMCYTWPAGPGEVLDLVQDRVARHLVNGSKPS